MTQILVTIEDVSIAARVMQAIAKVKGVMRTSLFQDVVTEEKVRIKGLSHTARINSLRGIAKGVEKEVKNDDRLAYLLEK